MNDGLELSKKYTYGCLFAKEKKVEFINNDKASYGITDDKFTECNQTEYNIIKEKMHKRLELIYNPEKNANCNKRNKGKKIEFSEINKKRRIGGNPYLKEMKDLFLLPDKSINYIKFYEKLNFHTERNYVSSTNDPNEVEAIILCFFHINDFDISANSPEFRYDETNSKYRIISDQEIIDEKILEETDEKIRNNIPIFPVYADIEYKYNSKTNELERQYFLSDGNHRIRTLKENKYNGMVPVIVCDYLISEIVNKYNNCEKTSIKGGSKKIKITYNNVNYIRTIRLDKNKKPYVLINKTHIYLKN